MASPSAGPPSMTRPESKDGSKDDEKDLGIEPVTITEMGHSEGKKFLISFGSVDQR